MLPLHNRNLLSWVADAVCLRRASTRDVMRECQSHREGCPAMTANAEGGARAAEVMRQVAALPRVVTLQQIADAGASALRKLLASEQR